MEQQPQEATSQPAATGQNNDRNIAVLAHVGGILFGFIPALIIWLMKKDESPYVAAQSKEALNFQLFIALCFLVSAILIFLLIGILLIWLVWLTDIIFCIIAAVKASGGENYRYPLTLRLIK